MSPVESLSRALHAAVEESASGSEPDVLAAVHGGLERGRRKRRHRRLVQVVGCTAGVVAVGTVSLFVTDGTPARPASTPTHAPSTPEARRTAPQYPATASSDKILDIRMHLPALLQQMLPSGTTVASAPKDWTTSGGAVFSVSGASGSSEVHVTSMPSDDGSASTDLAREFCGADAQGAAVPCDTRKVPGGTIYIADQDKTAADDSAHQAPPGTYQPGHEDDVVWRGLKMTFVPDDHSRPSFQIQEKTQVEAMPYASSPPVGSKTYQWPPTDNDVKSAVGTGLTISVDDFAGMIGKPQTAQIEHLLDTDVPPSQSAITERDAINAQLARLAAPVLPPGAKITVTYVDFSGNFLVLTGPTGVNYLEWYTDKHSHGLMATNNLTCQATATHCLTKKVPGATVQVTDQLADPEVGFSTYEYVPDDPAGKEVAIMLSANDPATAGPPEPDAKPVSPQLTDEQMYAIVTNPNIAQIMKETSLLAK